MIGNMRINHRGTQCEHVAVISATYADALASGQKTIESRLMRTRRPPLGLVRPGDRIAFKQSGGRFLGAWRAVWVREFRDLTPAGVRALAREFNQGVAAPHTYWQTRRFARYGVFIGLQPIAEDTRFPRIGRLFGTGWLCLANRLPREVLVRLSK